MFLWLISTEGIAGSIGVPWQTQNPEFKLSTSILVLKPRHLSLLVPLSWKETYHFLQVLAGPQR